MNRTQQGFTLVELIMFIVVVGIALAGIMAALRPGAEKFPDPFFRLRINELAHLYLEEVFTKKYDETTPEGGIPPCLSVVALPGLGGCTDPADFGPDDRDPPATGKETRDEFDDVDDYHNLREGECDPAAATTTLRDSRNLERVGYDGFCVEISVSYDGNYNGIGNEVGDNNEYRAKRVRVTVSHPFADRYTVTTYRGGF